MVPDGGTDAEYSAGTAAVCYEYSAYWSSSITPSRMHLSVLDDAECEASRVVLGSVLHRLCHHGLSWFEQVAWTFELPVIEARYFFKVVDITFSHILSGWVRSVQSTLFACMLLVYVNTGVCMLWRLACWNFYVQTLITGNRSTSGYFTPTRIRYIKWNCGLKMPASKQMAHSISGSTRASLTM